MKATTQQTLTAVSALLTAYGLSEDNAHATAHALVLAEAWGVGSHGLMRLPHYLRRLDVGGYSAQQDLAVVTDRGAVIVYDGAGGLGHWQLWQASKTAAERASEHGIAVAAVGNSGHCGALGVFTLPALARGHVCLVFSNGPAVMPAWGGATPLLSTSPLAIGLPDGDEYSIIDMATSSVARGKIAAYAARNEPLPEGWGLDESGAPTTDAQAALMGMLAPMGGAKGFALALMVETLTGGLVGPSLSTGVADMFNTAQDAEPQRIAHLVICLDAASLDASGDPAAGRARVAQLFDSVRSTGGRVPGESKHDLADDDGGVISVPDALVEELQSYARARGVDLGTWAQS